MMFFPRLHRRFAFLCSYNWGHGVIARARLFFLKLMFTSHHWKQQNKKLVYICKCIYIVLYYTYTIYIHLISKWRVNAVGGGLIEATTLVLEGLDPDDEKALGPAWQAPETRQHAQRARQTDTRRANCRQATKMAASFETSYIFFIFDAVYKDQHF